MRFGSALIGSAVVFSVVMMMLTGATPSRSALPIPHLPKLFIDNSPGILRESSETDPHDMLFDVEGHEISRAIARYAVGPYGQVYEMHSPHTEVPRLGSPKS